MTKIEEIMTGRKSPEDLKKGLKCAITKKCTGENCPYFRPEIKFNPLNLDTDEYAKQYSCLEKTRAEGYLYILHLEAKLSHTAETVTKEDAHGTETGEKHEAEEMADEGPGEAGAEPV